MKRTACFLFALTCMGFHAGDAFACSPVPGVMNETPEDKADRASLLFVGKVESASREEVVFVTHQGRARVSIKPDFSTCGVRFEVGQVWVYMGPSMFSGSFQVKDEDLGRSVNDLIDDQPER